MLNVGEMVHATFTLQLSLLFFRDWEWSINEWFDFFQFYFIAVFIVISLTLIFLQSLHFVHYRCSTSVKLEKFILHVIVAKKSDKKNMHTSIWSILLNFIIFLFFCCNYVNNKSTTSKLQLPTSVCCSTFLNSNISSFTFRLFVDIFKIITFFENE